MSKTIGVKLCKELSESNITSIVKIDKSFVPNDNTISIMNTDIRIQILSQFSPITTLNWQYIRGMDSKTMMTNIIKSNFIILID